MQGQPERKRSRDIRMVERAIVLQVLRDDHEERWSREELVGEISDFQPAVLDEALVRLAGDGVVHREDEQVWASRASRRLDELELISI
jgi:DNA-binding HxlR family transcriptional regulator